MTNRQWMQQVGAHFNLTAEDIELIAVNQGIDLDAAVNVTEVKTAMVKEFATVIPMANISEGGYSITWNMDAVRLWYTMTCEELGITPASKPRIRNASTRW